MNSLNSLRADIKRFWNPIKADFLQKYFKTTNEIDSRDIFRGLTVPQSRELAKKYQTLSLNEIEQLLVSEVHEERMIALFILVDRFKKGDETIKKQIAQFYIDHTYFIDNWDLVDSSADRILGEYLKDKPRDLLYKLAESDYWWERRIAVMATFQFIKELKDASETFKIADKLLSDRHDLIHKAVGWMLREIGDKVSIEQEKEFLNHHYKQMPRTMLRYAIEKLPENLRQGYLKGVI